MKAIQNLINKELRGQIHDIFTEIIQKKSRSAVEQTAPEFECNSCGVKPIVGTRYACSECRNFNFCESCEETVSHEHYFLKVRPPKEDQEQALQINQQPMLKTEDQGQNPAVRSKPPKVLDEYSLYSMAIELHEANHGSFDECIKAVRENNGDEAASIKALQ